jgi:hypothetical protein
MVYRLASVAFIDFVSACARREPGSTPGTGRCVFCLLFAHRHSTYISALNSPKPRFKVELMHRLSYGTGGPGGIHDSTMNLYKTTKLCVDVRLHYSPFTSRLTNDVRIFMDIFKLTSVDRILDQNNSNTEIRYNG